MFRFAVLLIVLISLSSCQHNRHNENKSTHQTQTNSIYHISSPAINNGESVTQKGKNFTDSLSEKDLQGNWYYEHDNIKYSIIIGNKFNDIKGGIYQVEGIPVYYILECKGEMKGNVFELYYRYTNDGHFFDERKIDRDKPIITLKKVNGKIVSYWNQLPGGRNGEECFKKKA